MNYKNLKYFVTLPIFSLLILNEAFAQKAADGPEYQTSTCSYVVESLVAGPTCVRSDKNLDCSSSGSWQIKCVFACVPQLEIISTCPGLRAPLSGSNNCDNSLRRQAFFRASPLDRNNQPFNPPQDFSSIKDCGLELYRRRDLYCESYDFHEFCPSGDVETRELCPKNLPPGLEKDPVAIILPGPHA